MSCTIISNFIDNYLKTMYNQKEQTYKGVIIMKSIITIGREFGSNGHKIGEELAKSLNIPFYDKEILTRASKESGMCEDIPTLEGRLCYTTVFTNKSSITS